MRLFYSVLIYLAAPIGLLMQLGRGLRDPSYRGHVGERFGFGRSLDGKSIWIHAVSVGEVQAAGLLAGQLLERHPEHRIVLTTVTPTGRERARLLFRNRVEIRYVPFDLPGSVKRFFDRVRPSLAIILETELWPNLYAECGRRRIPLVLASARMSPRSVGWYRRLVPLFRQTLSNGIVIAAQSEADAERFRSIGAPGERTHVAGNIKFDFEPAPEVEAQGRRWRELNAPGRMIWVAGSTHEGEEEIVLDAHRRARETFPRSVLLLVPRHPNRFDAVRELLARRGESAALHSSGSVLSPATTVVLGDTMGELMMFYAAADVAFVAGSLLPIGGHNLLEPASLGRPTLTGPYNFNGEEIANLLFSAGAARLVTNAAGLAQAVTELFSDADRRAAMGAAGKAVLDANRGALNRLLTLIEPLIH